MRIKLPAGATQKDIDDFMRSIEALPSNRKKPKNYCTNCGHFKQTGEEDYQGYCTVSCECATRIFNRESPSRWIPKKE